MQALSLMVVLVIACLAVPVGARAATLKDAYADQFLIGAALGGEVPKAYTPKEVELIRGHFNSVTPENCMKPGPIHPEEKTWKFQQADALVEFAQQNKMQVFGHTLVWHMQTGEWFFKDGDKAASRDMALARLKEHIHTLVGRYKGKIRGWDVVNEAISDKDGEYLGDTPWLKTVGEDYIEQAFRFAHEADPKAELQYNDYSIEMPGKRKKTIRLLKSLKEKGVPIHSVGIQGHWRLDHVPFKEIEEAIAEYRALGLKVAITELDLDVLPRRAEGADTAAKEVAAAALLEKKPASPEVLRRQAEQYGRLFGLFRKHRADLVRVTFWGLNDNRTWLNGWPIKRYNHPLLWDRESEAKPAFEAVINAK